MSESLPGFDIGGLSVPQRLALIAELCDSPPDSPEVAMPQWHRDELERRTAAADNSPDAAIPWEQILKSVGARR